MVTPIKPDDVVPSNYNDPKADLEHLIELINAELQNKVHKTTYPYNNDDGTFDSFRCVIYFDGNAQNNSDYREYVMWRNYHAEIMELYKQAGWGIKRWDDTVHYNHSTECPVPKYCIYLTQRPATEAAKELSGKVTTP